MQADRIQVGDVIVGIGRIDAVIINRSDRAIKGDTAKQGIRIRPNAKINSLLRARLAAEATEQVYEAVPVSVTVISGDARHTFGLTEQVEVESRSLQAAA